MALFSSKYNKKITEIEITVEQKEYVLCSYPTHGDHPLFGQVYAPEYPNMFFNVDSHLLYFKLKVGKTYRVKANIPENFNFPHVGRIIEIIGEV